MENFGLLAAFFVTAMFTAASHRASGSGLQCQRITVLACQGLGYNMTSMPNLAGHTTPLEAEIRIAQLLPLIESSCSQRTRFLLCSSLFPLCTPDFRRPVTACKSLCETVRTECTTNGGFMQLWPDFLNCDTLPQPEKQELCMHIPEEALKHREQRPHNQQQLQPLQQHHPSASYQQQQLYYWPWLPWKMPSHTSKSLAEPVICPHNFTVNPLANDECVPQCNKDAFHSTSQKKLAESLILGLSAVCFVLTLFSLVTFWAEPTRFGYPERPVLFLCLCYNLYSVCYLERIVFRSSSREQVFLEEPIGPITPPCSLLPPCLASYIITSYLSLSAATWWLIFTISFFLSSHKKWSSEALEKKSVLFHALAWVTPLAAPIAALLMDHVRPNELTGFCAAPGFMDIPMLVLLVFGLYFTIRASRSLLSIQQQMLPTFGHQLFSQIRKRFLIFSFVFFMPSVAGVTASLFRHYGSHVPTCSTREDCVTPRQITAWPTLLCICLQLAGGTLTGIWVWTQKTYESYRSRLVASPTTSTSGKSATSLPKKPLLMSDKTLKVGLLYNGIHFHNLPTYNGNQPCVM